MRAHPFGVGDNSQFEAITGQAPAVFIGEQPPRKSVNFPPQHWQPTSPNLLNPLSYKTHNGASAKLKP
jgi:hypothetical protein